MLSRPTIVLKVVVVVELSACVVCGIGGGVVRWVVVCGSGGGVVCCVGGVVWSGSSP